MDAPLLQSQVADYPCRRGKVRDVYDLGEQLVIVATDRISAFDWILPTGIPDKGRILTNMTLFWLDFLAVPNHLISTDVPGMPKPFAAQVKALQGRTMLVRKAEVVPIECVVRGYLAGSGWKEYRKSGTVCGLKVAPGLAECQQLPEPIFTPSTKAVSGHDENIPFTRMCEVLGTETASQLRDLTLRIYKKAATHARQRGIIIADTKFEFGQTSNGITLADEVLTPDSSRFWPADKYQPGRAQESYDKQYVRDYLEEIRWNKQPPAPALPAEVANRTSEKYLDAYFQLTGHKLDV